MSGGFVVMVLPMILVGNIKEELQQHQMQNICIPVPAHTSSFIDDINLFLLLENLEWLISCFEELGQPLGSIKLNREE